MHVYNLPWPRAALEQLENEVVTMKVTLSYFVEPNLTGKAATRPDTYRSFGLRFSHEEANGNRCDVPEPHFGKPGERRFKPDGETSYWLLGSKAVQAGSLHCDLWRGCG